MPSAAMRRCVVKSRSCFCSSGGVDEKAVVMGERGNVAGEADGGAARRPAGRRRVHTVARGGGHTGVYSCRRPIPVVCEWHNQAPPTLP